MATSSRRNEERHSSSAVVYGEGKHKRADPSRRVRIRGGRFCVVAGGAGCPGCSCSRLASASSAPSSRRASQRRYCVWQDTTAEIRIRGAFLLLAVFVVLTTRRQTLAAALLRATSLSFLVVAGHIGIELDLLRPAVYAALVAAGLLSVLLFPLTALTLLRGAGQRREDLSSLPADPASKRVTGSDKYREPLSTAGSVSPRSPTSFASGATADGGSVHSRAYGVPLGAHALKRPACADPR
jgi:hypothetical protein